jgi:glycerate kinase
MRILIAPDSMKGSLNAVDFCRLSEQVICRELPHAEVICKPMADGGEGTVDAFIEGAGGRYHHCLVDGPLGDPVNAKWGQLDNGTAVIEMAAAAGLTLIHTESLAPLTATTWGVGQLIIDALDNACTDFIIGLGGSATNDGGAGALQALGCGFFDINDEEIARGGAALQNLSRIDSTTLDPRLQNCNFTLACDVTNVLLGDRGATAIFGPQKGATSADLITLEKGLTQFNSILQQHGEDVVTVAGGGAAGGMAAGLLALLPAKLSPGFDIINQHLNLDVLLKTGIDLIITGEGSFDSQSLEGKLPIALATLAQQYSTPVIVITGARGEGYRASRKFGVTSVITLCAGPMTLEAAMSNAKELLTDSIDEICQLLKLGKA